MWMGPSSGKCLFVEWDGTACFEGSDSVLPFQEGILGQRVLDNFHQVSRGWLVFCYRVPWMKHINWIFSSLYLGYSTEIGLIPA